ncbi:hypothetical protein HanRHA438_Chr17g0800711 [Helianthus annuus]|nr:hypothetical protein HanRHA438_Chr17g0800711 [Helianthus annuus]
MHKYKNIKLCQLIPCTEPWPATKWYKSISLNRIRKPTRVKTHWIRKIFFIIMCSICSPKHLPPFRNNKPFKFNINCSFSKRPEYRRAQSHCLASHLPRVLHFLHIFKRQIFFSSFGYRNVFMFC